MNDRTDLDALTMRVIDLERRLAGRQENRIVTVAPSWATAHAVENGGVHWSRDIGVETLSDYIGPDAQPGEIGVGAVASDDLEVLGDGTVRVVRNPVEMFIDDHRMTTEQARTFGHAILSVVDAVEAARDDN